jgi:hypothetical protein
MIIDNNKLNNKEIYCTVCEDKEYIAVQTQYGEYEREECLCVLQRFFELHSIEVEEDERESNR